jgi:hypothetical protein
MFQNSEPSASFSCLFRSEYKWILYLTTMYVYCVYPAMSKKSENLSDLNKYGIYICKALFDYITHTPTCSNDIKFDFICCVYLWFVSLSIIFLFRMCVSLWSLSFGHYLSFFDLRILITSLLSPNPSSNNITAKKLKNKILLWICIKSNVMGASNHFQ